MVPNSFRLGPITVHLFGLMLAMAFLAASYVLGREFARKGHREDLASSAMVWAAIGSLIGARLWMVVEDPAAFVRDPWLLVSGSGFVFYGGLLGGAIAMTWFFRVHGIPWLQGADAAAPAIALGQAIGRVGCQLAGDGDWGAVTTVPWGMAYPYAVVGWPHPDGVRVHPTPIYEALAYLAVFLLLWRWRRAPHADGAMFFWYLILASGARFLVEFYRINPVVAAGLTAAQLTSLALMGIGVAGLLAQRRWQTVAA